MPVWGEVLEEFFADTGAGSAELRLPSPVLEGYRVLHPLGAHGQSEVYLAEDLQSGDRVAIKRWRLPSVRAEREFATLVDLDHPGVVRVRAGLRDRELGLPCLVMDYVDGTPLPTGRRRLPLADARRVFSEVAHALQYVHDQGLVHRDVKPANLMRRRDGSTVVIDFGLVKAGAQPAGVDVATGTRPVGTLPYMAPEQLGLLQVEVGPAADLYGLGATLFECLTGAVPFETNGAFERRGRDVWADPPQGADVGGVPAELQELVLRCLAFNPEDRPASAAEVAEVLAGELTPPPRRSSVNPWALALALGVATVVALGLRGAGPSEPVLTAPVHELVLQPDSVDGRDAHVSSVGLYRNDNYGSSHVLRVGGRPQTTGQAGEYRSFLAFDLGRVPEGAEVFSASLELDVAYGDFGGGPERLAVHGVLPTADGRTPWVEGTGLLDGKLDGVAWSGRFDPLFAGGASDRPAFTAPDVYPVPLEVVGVAHGSEQAWVRFDLSEAVRFWLRDSTQNHGVRISAAELTADCGAWLFASSDYPVAEQRPRLRVVYRGAAPRPAEEAGARRERALHEARTLLSYARTLLRRGNPEGAFEALSAACREAPFWARPYYERGLLAQREGQVAVVWVDSERGMQSELADPDPGVFALFAEAWSDREGDSAQALAALSAVVAACAPSCAARGDVALARVYAQAPHVFAQLARPEFRALLDERLDYVVARQRGLGEREYEGAVVTWVLFALATGDSGRARAELDAARARGVHGPVFEALSSLGLEEVAVGELGPALAAQWVRALVLGGELVRAREALKRARSAWGEDPGLARLAGAFLDE